MSAPFLSEFPSPDVNGAVVPDGWEHFIHYAPPCRTCPASVGACGAVESHALRAASMTQDPLSGAWIPGLPLHSISNFSDIGPWSPLATYTAWRHIQRLLSARGWISLSQPAGYGGTRDQGDGPVNWSEFGHLHIIDAGNSWVRVDSSRNNPRRMPLLGAFTPAWDSDSGEAEWTGGSTQVAPWDMISYPISGRSALVSRVQFNTDNTATIHFLGPNMGFSLDVDHHQARELVWNHVGHPDNWREPREPFDLWTVRKLIPVPPIDSWQSIATSKMADAAADSPRVAGTLRVHEVRVDGSRHDVTNVIISGARWRNRATARGVYVAEIRVWASPQIERFDVEFCEACSQTDPPETALCRSTDRCAHSQQSGWLHAGGSDRWRLATDGEWFCTKVWAKDESGNFTALVDNYSADCQQTNCPHYSPRESTVPSDGDFSNMLLARYYYSRQVAPGYPLYRIGNRGTPSICHLLGMVDPHPAAWWLYLPHIRYLAAGVWGDIETTGNVRQVTGAAIESDGSGLLGVHDRSAPDGEIYDGSHFGQTERQLPLHRAGHIAANDWTSSPAGPSESEKQTLIDSLRHVWPSINSGARRNVWHEATAGHLYMFHEPPLEINGETYSLELSLSAWGGPTATNFDPSRPLAITPYGNGASVDSALLDGARLDLFFVPALISTYATPAPFIPRTVLVRHWFCAGNAVAVPPHLLITNPLTAGNIASYGGMQRAISPGMTISLEGPNIPADLESRRFEVLEVEPFSYREYAGEATTQVVNASNENALDGPLYPYPFTILYAPMSATDTILDPHYIAPDWPPTGELIVEGERMRYEIDGSIFRVERNTPVPHDLSDHGPVLIVGVAPETWTYSWAAFGHSSGARGFPPESETLVEYGATAYPYKSSGFYRRDVLGPRQGSFTAPGPLIPSRAEAIALRDALITNPDDTLTMYLGIMATGDETTRWVGWPALQNLPDDMPACPHVAITSPPDTSYGFDIDVLDDFSGEWRALELTRQTTPGDGYHATASVDSEGIFVHPAARLETPASGTFHLFRYADHLYAAMPVELWGRAVRVRYTVSTTSAAVDISSPPDGPGIPDYVASHRLNMDRATIDLSTPSGAILLSHFPSGNIPPDTTVRVGYKGVAPSGSLPTTSAIVIRDSNLVLENISVAFDGPNGSAMIDSTAVADLAERAQSFCAIIEAPTFSRIETPSRAVWNWLLEASRKGPWLTRMPHEPFTGEGLILTDAALGQWWPHGETRDSVGNGSYPWRSVTPGNTVGLWPTATTYPFDYLTGIWGLGGGSNQYLSGRIYGRFAPYTATPIRHISSRWVERAIVDVRATDAQWVETTMTPEHSATNIENAGPVSLALYRIDTSDSYRILSGAESIPTPAVSDEWFSVDFTAPLKHLLDANPSAPGDWYIAIAGAGDGDGSTFGLEGQSWTSLFNRYATPCEKTDSGLFYSFRRFQCGRFYVRGLRVKIDLDAVMADVPELCYVNGANGTMPPAEGPEGK